MAEPWPPAAGRAGNGRRERPPAARRVSEHAVRIHVDNFRIFVRMSKSAAFPLPSRLAEGHGMNPSKLTGPTLPAPRRAPAPRGARAAALLCLLLAPVAAAADDRPGGEPPFSIGAEPAWYLLGGVSGGGSLASDDNGGFVGGELSLVRLRQGRWVGAYVDGGYEFGQDAPFLSLGPELGVSVVGIDGGAFLRFDDDGLALGPQGRLVVGLGLFSVYARYAYMLEAERNEHIVQIGAMFKMPMMSPFGQGPATSR
jgi:hypothetical protein